MKTHLVLPLRLFIQEFYKYLPANQKAVFSAAVVH